MRCAALLLGILAFAASSAFAAAEEKPKDLKGQPAAALTSSLWVGMPVSLDAVKGNTVILFFWNADAPC